MILLGDLPEREAAVIEHVRPLGLLLRVTGIDVEEGQFFVRRDLPDEIVHAFRLRGVGLEIGVEGIAVIGMSVAAG